MSQHSDGAQVYGLGYRRYEGARQARAAAIRTLAVFTLRRVLGLGRGFRHKILPGVTLLIAYAPALISVATAALTEGLVADDLVSYGEYTFFIGSALALFAALVAPEALCPDRRSGLFGLYLAGPLDRTRYLVAKWIAVIATMLMITLGPLLFMLLAYAVAGLGPSVGDIPLLLLRIVVTGVVIACLYATVALTVSSFTTRRALAAVAIALVLFVPLIIASAAVEQGAAGELELVSTPVVASELSFRIFGEEPETESAVSDVATPWVVAAFLATVLVGAAVSWYRYQRIEVTK